MAKGKYAKKKAPFVDLYGVLLLIATLAMSIAYAEIVGTEITISTKAEATAQEGVFITDVICNESNSVSNNYMATTLDSSITLDSPTDTKNFTITIYNKTLKPYVFVGVKKLDKWDEFTGIYNNTNISYTLGSNMVPHETIVQPKDWIVFNVDLGFNGQGQMPETLRSLLNFSFQEIPTLEIVSEDTIENMYPNCEEKVYEFTVSNQRQDAEHGLITNGVPLTYTISPNVPAPLTAKIYDKDGVEVATDKDITISSEAKEEQTYTMKVKWDNTNPENGKEYNSAEYAGQTLASSINLVSTPDIIDNNDKYIGYTLNKSEPVEIKTEPLYFGITTDKTTVEMNNTTNAESIILTIKNNDGAEKINSFPVEYKLSIDNSKFTLYVNGNEVGEETQTLGNTATISQEHEIQLVTKDEQELEATENCNLSIEAISPYAKTETIELEIKDNTGPTAPVIEGGSTGTYATSQTISVSQVSTDVGTGVGKYQYLLNNTESTETESIADVTTTATSQTFTEHAPGYYVYFRAVDNAGNPGEWSNAQQIYIDTAEPIVGLADGVESEITIEEGESNDVASYFKHDKNGNAGIKSVTYTVNGTPIENTDELTASDTPYTIICTVTKDTNASKTASIVVTVEAWEPIVQGNGKWNGTVNKPLLMKGMTAVYWSTDGGTTASTTQEGASPIYSKVGGKSTGADNSAFNWDNWYNYVAGDNATDTKTSRWANAVTDDGSYWVWVPRYKYLISDQPTEAGNTNAGKIDIKFIPTTDKKGTTGYTTAANSESEMLTKDSSGYIIHPAFENGSSTGKNNGFANGEWDKDLPGFWVAKYEMSMENASGNNVNTSDSTIGNVKIGDTAKMVSKPGVQSWRYIQIGQIYQNCLLYDEAKGSHMMKNSEWGATAYLTHSQYGRNRNEITINDSSGCYTGNAGASPTDSSTQETIGNAYNTTAGMLASTTGNIYGVYDMSGGAWEYTAGWDTKSTDSNISNYGKSAVDGTVYFTSGGSSDKYKTAYSNGTSTSSESTVKTVCRIGDGIKETWISSSFAWFNDFSYFVRTDGPFSVRGSNFMDARRAGVFGSYGSNGGAYDVRSFRAVLASNIAGKVSVEANQATLEITEGTENTFASLFTVTTADGGTATKIYTLNGASASANSNTSALAVGTHTITCTATYNGMSDSATMTVVVESASGTLATTKVTIKPSSSSNVQIVVPAGFGIAKLEGSNSVNSLPTQSGKVIGILPNEEWNNITVDQINQGIVVVNNAITYDGGNATGTVPDFEEYVWVPIPDSSSFARKAWTTARGPDSSGSYVTTGVTHPLAETSTENRWWEDKTTTEYKNMVSSVTTNKGFYIGRYEASSKSSIVAQSKRGQTTWTNISQTNAITYSTNSSISNSHLIYGIEWDSALNWLIGNATIGSSTAGTTKTMELSDIQTNSASWGNYNAATGNAAINSGSRRTTGYSEYWKANNIYDLAGNVYELTQEKYSTGSDYAGRGGYWYYAVDYDSAALRMIFGASYTNGGLRLPCQLLLVALYSGSENLNSR